MKHYYSEKNMVNFVSNEVKLDFSDVLLVPSEGGPNSRKKVILDKNVVCKYSLEVLNGPGIIAANMDGVGTIEVANTLSMYKVYTALTKTIDFDKVSDFFMKGYQTENTHPSDYAFYSMGISDADYEKFVSINKKVPINRVCIDVANGYMSDFSDYISQIRDLYPNITILAGNVVTPEAVETLAKAGADIIKMGIGSGAVCTTRLVTGIGYPQFSTIVDSLQAADENGVSICSDGGCTTSGDVAKALAAGADFVMLGTMLAGSTEGNSSVDENGNITFYGMSSKTANDKHFGGLKSYRSSEGRTISIKHRGTMHEILTPILGGIASACTYSNCLTLDQLPINAKFIKVNNTYNRSVESFTIGY